MWLTYVLGAATVLAVAAAWFCWRLYQDAIRREIATSEVFCGVLLSPMLHLEFQDVAYSRIDARFPSGADAPSNVEIGLLQRELMTVLGNSALLFVSQNGPGATLRRILTGPYVVGRNPDELWRFAKPKG